MPGRSTNIFPGLASKMAFKYHDNYRLADILGISYYSVLRRLNGEVEFELGEIKSLMREYDTSFESLFEKEQSKKYENK